MTFGSVLASIVWGLAPLSLLLSIAVALRPNPVLRRLASTSLLAAAIGLVAALALPSLLPVAFLIRHPEGGTNDPRVIAALLLGLATLLALLPGMRGLRLAALGQLTFWLPGIVVGLLVAVGGYLLGLQHAAALTGLVLGGTVFGSAIVLAARLRGSRVPVASALQAGSLALVVVAAMLSLHGARAERLSIAEGTSLDTLGTHLDFATTVAPHDSLRRLGFTLGADGRRDTLWVELKGRAGQAQQSLAAGRAFAGPVLLPLALEETRTNPHGVVWIKKGESVQAGDAVIKFEKFRFEMGDTIRLFADLEVVYGGTTTKVSPGAVAHSKGENPFSATVEGYGPIAIAGVDADNGRVGLMLPTLANSGVTRTALVDLTLRPALPLAWVGAALGLLAFLFALGGSGADRRTETRG